MRVPAGLLLALVLSACGPKTMEARLRDAEQLADKASGYLDRAEKAAIQLEPRDMESALDDAKRVLLEKDIELYPESQMHVERYKELAARLPQVKAEREKRDLDRRLNAARDKIVPRVTSMLEAQDAVPATAPTRAGIETLENKARAVKDAVDDELDLFVKDADFAAWAKSQRNKVDKALESAARAKKGLAFLEGPAVSWRDGQARVTEARGKKDLSDKESELREARTRFGDCERGAKSFDEDKNTNGISFVMASGRPQTPAQLAETCRDALKDAEAQWKKALAALEVEKAKKKAQEAREKAQAAKEEKARELKEAKEKKARELKEAKEKKARELKEAKEKKARELKEAKEKKARELKEAKEKQARAAKEAKEKAARARKK